MNIILFGPPGAGKGTQAKYLVKQLKSFQISTGDMLRDEIQKNSEIGKKIVEDMSDGKFVSDKIVNSLIEKIIFDPDKKNKLIFDGYPRSLTQAKNLDNLLEKYKQKIDIVLKLSVSLKTVKKRISERRGLEKRSDDNEEIAIRRFETYEKSTEPVIEYYKKLNLLKVVDGERPIDQINNEISAIISAI